MLKELSQKRINVLRLIASNLSAWLARKITYKEKRFKVQGAGKLIISKRPTCSCGTARGFHIGTTWGTYGEAGGVMDWKDALKLATSIYINLILGVYYYTRKLPW
jgi:hypothetical protein